MAKPVPIPSDLWRRLAALDAAWDIVLRRCDVGALSAGGYLQTGRNYKRVWVVELTRRSDGRAVGAEHASLPPALDGAIQIAVAVDRLTREQEASLLGPVSSRGTSPAAPPPAPSGL